MLSYSYLATEAFFYLLSPESGLGARCTLSLRRLGSMYGAAARAIGRAGARALALSTVGEVTRSITRHAGEPPGLKRRVGDTEIRKIDT